MYSSQFVKIVNNHNQSLPKSFGEVRFKVSDDLRLHLGDNYFLQKICDRLNVEKSNSNFIIYLTIIRRLDNHRQGFYIGLDWSKPIFLSVDEHIRFALKSFWSDIKTFQIPESYGERRVVLSTEITSNKLRVLGLKKNFVPILQVFLQEGFKIIHHGKSLPSWLATHGIDITENINNLKLGEVAIAEGKYYAYVGYDNYWMHVSAFHNLRRYIIQRRKFTFVNLLNHVGSLNVSTLESTTHYIS